jgi:3-hydroxyisobutyrate dehydrogenase
MLGGDEKVYEQCLPVLRAIGQNIFHMGKTGPGHMTKALSNFLSAANYLAAGEARTVASKCGLDPAKFVGAVNANSGMSFATVKHIPNQSAIEPYEEWAGMESRGKETAAAGTQG